LEVTIINALTLINNYKQSLVLYCPFEKEHNKRPVRFEDVKKLKEHISKSHHPPPAQKKALFSLISYCEMALMIGLVRCKHD